MKNLCVFAKNLEKCVREFIEFPTLTIENDGLKVTMELTENLMKELISKFVNIYGLETVVKSAVESTN